MNRLWKVTITSLVPGLGFLLMGQYRRAMKSAGAVILAALITYMIYRFAPTQYLRDISWYILGVVWFVQIYNSMNAAWLVHKREQDITIAPRKDTTIEFQHDQIEKLPKIERIRTLVKQQLSADEHLIAAIDVNVPYFEAKSWGQVDHIIHPCYVAITQDNLLVMEIDFEGIIMTTARIPRSEIVDLDYKEGILKDTITLTIIDKPEIKMDLPRRFRTSLKQFADLLLPD